MIPGISIIHEDNSVLVVDKPPGMLSQPGRTVNDSVLTRVLEARPDATGSVLVHRLDMDTSGLLVLAKNKSAHRHLQQQFEHRKVGKRYIAKTQAKLLPLSVGGRIHLPLRLNIDDRPHQIVCNKHGKPATTLWHRASSDTTGLLWLYPLTGRTHQLRVHLAHEAGLGAPIMGDRLYGTGVVSGRLMLHAQYLAFDHPDCGVRQSFESPAPFVQYESAF